MLLNALLRIRKAATRSDPHLSNQDCLFLIQIREHGSRKVAACRISKEGFTRPFYKDLLPFRTLRAILSATESASRRSVPQKEIDTIPAPT